MEKIRLNKFLSETGLCSRREADRLIENGRITVDGVCAVTGMRVDDSQEICLDGKPVHRQEEKLLFLLYKPRGVVCTEDRRWGDVLVGDLIDVPQRLYPIGRLDKESEGLLLMTNQGDLFNKIMKSENRHEKEYVVTVDRPLADTDLKRLAGGMYLPELDRKTRPCRVRRIDACSFRIVLTQGLNRQIRRMCEQIGAHVTRLCRVRIMNLHLDGLREGQWRPVTSEEMTQLQLQLKDSSNNTEHRYRRPERIKERHDKAGI